MHGVPTLGLRFFNVFGPRQDPALPYSSVISVFCDRLSRGEPATISGDGGQTRDFIFVEDVVEALLRAMDRTSVIAPVLNVCTGRTTSVRTLASVIAGLCAETAAPRLMPARAVELRHSQSSPQQANALLGLAPPHPLESGLAQVLHWLEAGQPTLAAEIRSRMVTP